MPSPIFGILEVNTAINLAHLASGSFAVVTAFRGTGSMRMAGKILGCTYLLLAVVGFAAPEYDWFALVALTGAANWLHLAIAAFFGYYALLAAPVP
jgi:hypothetical protein